MHLAYMATRRGELKIFFIKQGLPGLCTVYPLFSWSQLNHVYIPGTGGKREEGWKGKEVVM